MSFIPKIIPTSKKEQDFVVLDIGLGRVSIAIFRTVEGEKPKFIGVGRRSFTSPETLLDATLEATDALGAIVDELPTTAIVGVSGGSLEAQTVTAKYERENTKKPFSKEELDKVLHKVIGHEKPDHKIFFSAIVGAKIDNAKVTNPLGIKGTQAEIDCFVARKESSEIAIYDQVIDELEIKPVKIVPTEFAVTQNLQEKLTGKSLILRVGTSRTEVTQVNSKTLDKITNFDLGFEESEFFNFALEAILESQPEKEKASNFWLYSDNDSVDLEKVKKIVSERNWKKDFKLENEIKVHLIPTEENFNSSDIGMLSLAQMLDK